jgi:hypothetical protein
MSGSAKSLSNEDKDFFEAQKMSEAGTVEDYRETLGM